MLFEILKTVHVLAAIAAFGANISYFVWFRRAVNNPEARTYTLRTIRLMERAYVNPSYAVAGVTGLWLIQESHWDFTTPWVVVSIVMYLLMMALGIAVYAPLMRRQIRLAEAGGEDSGEYRKVDRLANSIAAVLVVVVVFVVYIMTVSPALWG
jgi:uncharacterized membrane protein